MNFRLRLDSETVEHTDPVDPVTVTQETSVREVFRTLKEHGRGSVLVCEQGVLVGIFTERDALRLMASNANLDVPVQKHMSANPETLAATDTVGAAIKRMSEGHFRQLPIVGDSGSPKGLLKVSTILRYLVEHFPRFIYNLPPKPHHSTQEREGA